MASSPESNPQHIEGVFVRSVVNQIHNLTVQTTSKEEIKKIVSQLLMDNLPELVKHPAIAQEIRENAYKILSDLIDQNKLQKEDDLSRTAGLVWQHAELELSRALAGIIREADKTVERVFKERDYQRLYISLEPSDSKIYDIYLIQSDCFEFRVRPSSQELYLSICSSSLRSMMGENPFYDFKSAHFFFAGKSGTYAFQFVNKNNNNYTGELLYRLREADPGFFKRGQVTDRCYKAV